MRIVVIGLGISGQAVSRYFLKRGDEVIGVDRIPKQIEGVTHFLESEPIWLSNVDLVVKSPGIPATHPWVQTARKLGLQVVGEIDIALEELRKKNKIIFGITGSNGKTTTTLMAAHLLNEAGIPTIAAGNVGVPLIAEIENSASVFVIELSSFQLEEIAPIPVFDKAIILNITPNHIDRHATFESYLQAKMRIASCLKENGVLYLSERAAKVCQSLAKPFEIFDNHKEKIDTTFNLRYREGNRRFYPHDLENLSAALALACIPDEIVEKGMLTFKRPPHRLEFVREVNGVSYINDSKATSVDAVIKAVQALDAPILLIAGGVDKGGSFQDWIKPFAGKVRAVFAIGQAAKRIESELTPEVIVQRVFSLEEGVMRAAKIATSGNIVLLSPGCSSYDEFKDYQHRGDTFREIVEEKI